jgi:hypothetical protein
MHATFSLESLHQSLNDSLQIIMPLSARWIPQDVAEVPESGFIDTVRKVFPQPAAAEAQAGAGAVVFLWGTVARAVPVS